MKKDGKNRAKAGKYRVFRYVLYAAALLLFFYGSMSAGQIFRDMPYMFRSAEGNEFAIVTLYMESCAVYFACALLLAGAGAALQAANGKLRIDNGK